MYTGDTLNGGSGAIPQTNRLSRDLTRNHPNNTYLLAAANSSNSTAITAAGAGVTVPGGGGGGPSLPSNVANGRRRAVMPNPMSVADEEYYGGNDDDDSNQMMGNRPSAAYQQVDRQHQPRHYSVPPQALTVGGATSHHVYSDSASSMSQQQQPQQSMATATMSNTRYDGGGSSCDGQGPLVGVPAAPSSLPSVPRQHHPTALLANALCQRLQRSVEYYNSAGSSGDSAHHHHQEQQSPLSHAAIASMMAVVAVADAGHSFTGKMAAHQAQVDALMTKIAETSPIVGTTAGEGAVAAAAAAAASTVKVEGGAHPTPTPTTAGVLIVDVDADDATVASSAAPPSSASVVPIVNHLFVCPFTRRALGGVLGGGEANSRNGGTAASAFPPPFVVSQAPSLAGSPTQSRHHQSGGGITATSSSANGLHPFGNAMRGRARVEAVILDCGTAISNIKALSAMAGVLQRVNAEAVALEQRCCGGSGSGSDGSGSGSAGGASSLVAASVGAATAALSTYCTAVGATVAADERRVGSSIARLQSSAESNFKALALARSSLEAETIGQIGTALQRLTAVAKDKMGAMKQKRQQLAAADDFDPSFGSLMTECEVLAVALGATQATMRRFRELADDLSAALWGGDAEGGRVGQHEGVVKSEFSSLQPSFTTPSFTPPALLPSGAGRSSGAGSPFACGSVVHLRRLSEGFAATIAMVDDYLSSWRRGEDGDGGCAGDRDGVVVGGVGADGAPLPPPLQPPAASGIPSSTIVSAPATAAAPPSDIVVGGAPTVPAGIPPLALGMKRGLGGRDGAEDPRDESCPPLGEGRAGDVRGRGHVVAVGDSRAVVSGAVVSRHVKISGDRGGVLLPVAAAGQERGEVRIYSHKQDESNIVNSSDEDGEDRGDGSGSGGGGLFGAFSRIIWNAPSVLGRAADDSDSSAEDDSDDEGQFAPEPWDPSHGRATARRRTE